MKLSLRVLRYFVTAADHGSVTAAARTLRISQPTISLAIGQIEDELGVELFVRRHARGIALTPAGTQVLREARKLLANADDFMAAASETGAPERGVLQLGCLSYLAPRFLGALLRETAVHHPGIEIEILEGGHDELVEELSSGRIEVALTYDLLLTDRLRTRQLLELPPYLLVPARHRLVRRGAVYLREIIEEPCILLDLPISQDYFGSLFGGLGLRPNVRHRSKSVETVRSLVANGLGYTILNQIAKSTATYDGRSVRAIALLDDLRPARVVAAYLAGTRPRPVAELFAGFCSEHFHQVGALPPKPMT